MFNIEFLRFNCGSICSKQIFSYVHFKSITKTFAGLTIFFLAFSIFYKNQNLLMHIFVIFSIHNPSLGSPHKIGTGSVQPFWSLSETNGQTDRERQAKHICLINAIYEKNYLGEKKMSRFKLNTFHLKWKRFWHPVFLEYVSNWQTLSWMILCWHCIRGLLI